MQSIKTNLTYFKLNPRVILSIESDYCNQIVIRAFSLKSQSVLIPEQDVGQLLPDEALLTDAWEEGDGTG